MTNLLKWIALLFVLLGGVAALGFWAFGSTDEAPLTADSILVFDSQRATADRYGYIGKSYTAALPAFADEAHPQSGTPHRVDGFDHYFRIRFAAERPAAQIRADALAELNRIRRQKGKRTWNNAALLKAQLYTISADIDMTGGKRGHAGPDCTMFQRDDTIQASLRALFSSNPGAGQLAVDPGDPHVLAVTIKRDTGVMTNGTWSTVVEAFTMRFASDWKTAEISLPDAGGGTATVTATTQDATVPEGPYLLTLATTGIVNATTGAEYMFAGMRDAGRINPTIPVYLHRDGDSAGKAYLVGKTYRLHAGTRDGALKLFADDVAVLSIDPARPTSSLLRYGSLFVSYTATLTKADLHGKEQQLAANLATLGNVPETVTGAPNVWGTYFDLRQRQYTAKDILTDPALRQVFGHAQTSAAGGSMALEAAATHPARPTAPTAHAAPRLAHTPAAAAPDPNRPRTDAEIIKEMQDKLRRKRGY
jgi:hypothetical protein